MMQSVERLANAGIPILVLGTLPERATGFADHEQRDEAVRESVQRLRSQVRFVSDAQGLGSALRSEGLEPVLEPLGDEEFGFALDHREQNGTHILFLFNESYSDLNQRLRLHVPARRVRLLYPESGGIAEVNDIERGLDCTIQARRSRVLLVEE